MSDRGMWQPPVHSVERQGTSVISGEREHDPLLAARRPSIMIPRPGESSSAPQAPRPSQPLDTSATERQASAGESSTRVPRGRTTCPSQYLPRFGPVHLAAAQQSAQNGARPAPRSNPTRPPVSLASMFRALGPRANTQGSAAQNLPRSVNGSCIVEDMSISSNSSDRNGDGAESNANATAAPSETTDGARDGSTANWSNAPGPSGTQNAQRPKSRKQESWNWRRRL
jgi:hypothetical protein